MTARRLIRTFMTMAGLAGTAISAAAIGAEDTPGFDEMRARMVAIVEFHAAVVNAETGLPMPDQRILDAMGEVERHAFVPHELAPLAYFDTPLPVGHDQNIAQPYIIALMTQLAGVQPGDRVFETGTGAGYHAALLSELGADVVSVEIVPALADRAAGILHGLGYDDIEIHIADGYDGWSPEAPFDVMLIKESVADVPPALLRQLAPEGRMVVPIGPADGQQFLTVISKDKNGHVSREKFLPVRFSPFQGGQRT